MPPLRCACLIVVSIFSISSLVTMRLVTCLRSLTDRGNCKNKSNMVYRWSKLIFDMYPRNARANCKTLRLASISRYFSSTWLRKFLSVGTLMKPFVAFHNSLADFFNHVIDLGASPAERSSRYPIKSSRVKGSIRDDMPELLG